jgi:transposase-like protein
MNASQYVRVSWQTKEKSMSTFESIVQRAAEQLMENERLRSNLTDDEANTLLDWAIEWLESQVDKSPDEVTARQAAQAEVARLRPAMQEINRQLAEGKRSTAGLPAAMSLAQALPCASRDRQSLIKSLIAQKVEAWSKQ